jgi:hypothetical protein
MDLVAMDLLMVLVQEIPMIQKVVWRRVESPYSCCPSGNAHMLLLLVLELELGSGHLYTTNQ